MANRFWVGGSGTWDATTTTNWSVSTGGAGGASAPTSADDVFFDAGSDAGGIFTVTVGTNAVCRDITAGSLDFTMSLSLAALSILGIYGSSTFPATNFTITGTGDGSQADGFHYLSTTTGKTITTNGVSYGNHPVRFNGVGGGWTLASAFTTAYNLYLLAGALNTAGYTVTTTGVQSTGVLIRSLSLGASSLVATGASAFTFQSSNYTLDSGTSTITCSATSPSFFGGSLTYYNVSFTSTAAGTYTITGDNTFNNLTFTSLAATGLRFISVGANQTVSGTLTFGTANTAIRRMFVLSDTIGVQRSITVNGTVATLADVDFRDIVTLGTFGTWSGTRLGNCLGNTGITFDAGKNCYRIGTGNWSDTQWALTSGGAVNVNNFPLAQDTAIFDTGTTTGTHTIDFTNINIGGMNFSALTVPVTLTSSVANVNIYGNVVLDTDVTLSGTSSFNFSKQGGTQTITSAGRTFTQAIIVNAPTGTVQLTDNLTISAAVTLTSGTLDLNNNTLTAQTFSSNNSNTRAIAFGTGQIDLTYTGAFTIVINMFTVSNFTCTGSKNVRLTGLTATQRNIDFGINSGGNESNALNLTILGSGLIGESSENAYLNFDLSAFTGTLMPQHRTIYGNLTLSSGMTLTASTVINSFSKSSGTQTITTNGKTIDLAVNKIGAGTLQLTDALTIGSTRTLTHTAGTLDLNDLPLSVGTYSSTGATARSIDFGTGTFTNSGATFTVSGSNFTTVGTGKVDMTSASTKTFAGGGFSYPTLNQGGAGALNITGSNTFKDITNTVQPVTVTFTSGTTTTVDDFNLSGTAGNLVTIKASTPASQFNLVLV